MSNTTRRKTLALTGAASAWPFLPRIVHAGSLESLALFGPPAGPSITLSHAVATDAFEDMADSTSFSAWRNPDELRAGLTSGSIDLSVVPVQAAANLYNRGFPLKLANIMTEGLLYIVSSRPEITSLGSLKGQKLAVPFRGDTPDIILGQLLQHAGLDPDVDIEKQDAGTPIEAMQFLLSDRVDAALLAEPAASAAILHAKKAGKEMMRSIDIQTAWGAMTGKAPVLPQAGLAVTEDFLEEHSEVMPPLLAALEEVVADVQANPAVAAGHASNALGLPAPVIATSIPHSRLVARRADAAMLEIETMLTAMAGPDMAKIGGKLPDDGFYL